MQLASEFWQHNQEHRSIKNQKQSYICMGQRTGQSHLLWLCAPAINLGHSILSREGCEALSSRSIRNHCMWNMTTNMSIIMILTCSENSQGASRSTWRHSRVSRMTLRHHLNDPEVILRSQCLLDFSWFLKRNVNVSINAVHSEKPHENHVKVHQK